MKEGVRYEGRYALCRYEDMTEDRDHVNLLCRVLDLDVDSAIDFVLLRHGDATHTVDIT